MDDNEHWAPRFSPDGNEVFWWMMRVDEENHWLEIHKTMRRIGDRWTESEISPFDNTKYLFFTLAAPGQDEDVFWVSTNIIEKLREASH